ncbi:MAG: hypothetical protein JST80_10940 [Bdellovibrionales bacterium]|nr:hypothetical protein [Bdellovibrionales bacterium]
MRALQGFFGFVVVVSLGVVPAAQAYNLAEIFNAPFVGQLQFNTFDPPANVLPIPCLNDAGKQITNFMNNTVLDWKETSKDQFKTRALVQGPISTFFNDHTGHAHFGINLNSDGISDLEVIYNEEFGALPDNLTIGQSVTACGDFIVARKIRPSPLGALIHWVHYNPGDRDGGRHPHGYLVISGRAYGLPANGVRH